MSDHPIQLNLEEDDLTRSRLTVFFRPLLAVPHFVWILLWSVGVFVIHPFVWLIAVVTGRLPSSIHRFYAAYVRYVAHVSSYVLIVGRPFPGFTGEPGSYPVEVTVPAQAEPQRRWTLLLRLFLAIPAFFIASALNGAQNAVFVLAWLAGTGTARMPRGLRDLGAYAVRYHAQMTGYVLMLTPRYPHSSPYVGGGPSV